MDFILFPCKYGVLGFVDFDELRETIFLTEEFGVLAVLLEILVDLVVLGAEETVVHSGLFQNHFLLLLLLPHKEPLVLFELLDFVVNILCIVG